MTRRHHDKNGNKFHPGTVPICSLDDAGGLHYNPRAMRRLLFSLLAVCAMVVSAASPDDQYISIYNLIQHGDALAQTGQSRAAIDKYLEAQKELLKIQSIYPNWNDKVVKFRLGYLADRLQALSATAATNTPPPTAPTTTPPATANPDLLQQIEQLKNQVRNFEGERSALEAKLREALAARPQSASVEDLSRAEARIKSVMKERDLLQVALQQQSTSKREAASRQERDIKKVLAEENKRIKALEKERDDLRDELASSRKEVAALKRDLSNAKRPEPAPRVTRSNNNNNKDLLAKISTLEARVQALEAKPTPLTAEEKALFRPPPTQLAKTEPTPSSNPTPATAETQASEKRDVRQVPAGAGPLVAEAERAFAARRFDEAEKKYLEVLNQDKENVYTLANLAAIQLEMNRADEAEKNLKAALAKDPNDAYSLNLYGMLKFRQENYDEALNYLGKSAQLNPNNAETQNYLGVTLSQKGQQTPAEAALRKAIQLQPGYASAHHNLAIIYATQKPPFTELARYHYDRAVALGHPRNDDLEKMLSFQK